MKNNLFLYTIPIAIFFIFQGVDYLRNPQWHVQEQRRIFLIYQQTLNSYLNIFYFTSELFYGEKLVFFLGWVQIFIGISLFSKDYFYKIIAALYLNIFYVIFDNPLIIPDTQYSYHEVHYPHLIENYNLNGIYRNLNKQFYIMLGFIGVLWYLGMSETKGVVQKELKKIVDQQREEMEKQAEKFR